MLQVRGPIGMWGLLYAALFHTARARRADDLAVQDLERLSLHLGELLLGQGMSDEQLDAIIQHLAICEHCGCAPHRPCEGGCQWSVPHAGAERFVCSRCTDKVSPPGQDRYGAAVKIILRGDPGFVLPGR